MTSASEVAVPGISDLLLAFLDQSLDSSEVLSVELVVPRQLNLRLDPELRLAVGRLHMDMRSSSREKKKNLRRAVGGSPLCPIR